MSATANALQSTSILDSLPQSLRQFLGLGIKEAKPEYVSSRKSKDGKGMLFVVSKSHSSTKLITYKLTHKKGKGEILVIFNHLGKLRKKLDQAILKYVAAGNLAKAEALCKQRKNMRADLYTHRLQIFRVNNQKVKHLSWLIDIDFHKTDSYGSGTGMKVISAFLESLLNSPLENTNSGDYLDDLLTQDLSQRLQKQAEETYLYFSQKRIKCMVSGDPNHCHLHYLKSPAHH